MDDRGRVQAIRAGDPRGLASTYDAYADALFAFCHSMLRSRHAAEDAVQDTFIVLAERVAQLRDPARLRPWLYAVARTQCLHQLRSAKRVTPTDEVADVMDESADLDAGLHSDMLRELVWQAADGLNSGERAALELSLRHGLEGADLAAALGVSRATSTKLLQRARDELERGLGALLVARSAPASCAELAGILQGWDGTLTVLMRKRIGRHIDGCAACGAEKRQRVNAAALLAAVPLLAAPAALRSHVLERLNARDVSYNRTVASRAGWFDDDGFPSERVARRRAVGATVAVAGLIAIVLMLAVLPPRSHRAAFPVLHAATVSNTPTSAAPSSRAVPSPHAVPSPRAAAPATRAVLPTRIGSVPGHAAPSGTPPQVSSAPSAAPSTPAKPPPPGTLSVSPTKVDFGSGSSQDVKLTAVGGPLNWTASVPSGITVSQSGGSLPADGSVTVTLLLHRVNKKAGSATVTMKWNGGASTIPVSWAP